MVICPSCQTQNEPGAAFCDNCGAALPQPGAAPQPAAPPPPAGVPPVQYQPPAAPAYTPPAPPPPQPAGMGYQPTMVAGGTCTQCGTPLTPGAAFCDNCGAPVSAAGVPQPAPGPQPPYPQQPPPPVYPPPQPQVYPQPQPQPQPYPAPQPIYGTQPRLVIQATNTPVTMPPGKAEYIIGREDPVSGIFPDVDLTPHGGDEGGVSRRHARLFQQGGQWYIEDYNTTNFTYVNNQKLQPGMPVPVPNGAELRFGRVKVMFYVQ